MGWRVLIVLIFVAAAVILRVWTDDREISIGLALAAAAAAGVRVQKKGGPNEPQ